MAAQFEDAIAVMRSTLLAMERTPSVASGKRDEDLREPKLGAAERHLLWSRHGRNFIRNGKTDILLKYGDRHVFTGECKWWKGQKACAEAVDQLLRYMPWRNVKAALLMFIDTKDASAVLEKADAAIKGHRAFKRIGVTTADPSGRRNYVLGNPDDADREIQLTALFAVLPQ